MASNRVHVIPRDVQFLREFFYQPHKYNNRADLLRIRVNKLSTDEVLPRNKEIASTANFRFADQRLPVE